MVSFTSPPLMSNSTDGLLFLFGHVAFPAQLFLWSCVSCATMVVYFLFSGRWLAATTSIILTKLYFRGTAGPCTVTFCAGREKAPMSLFFWRSVRLPTVTVSSEYIVDMF